MNGATARKIRKIVYGTDFSNRYRKYKRSKMTGAIIADEKRRRYQKIKKEYIKGNFLL
jgi:hypothetical protein